MNRTLVAVLLYGACSSVLAAQRSPPRSERRPSITAEQIRAHAPASSPAICWKDRGPATPGDALAEA